VSHRNFTPPLRVEHHVTARPHLHALAAAGIVLAAVVLAGCSGGGEAAPAGGSEVAVNHGDSSLDDGYHGAALSEPYDVPAVDLTDTSGAAFDLVSDTTEPVTLVFFGYTNCPDICNLVMADIASAMTRLDDDVAEQVQMLFVTTDPARDSPAAIREYLDRFDPSFEGLTGPLRRIESAARPLGVLIEGTKKLESGGYEVGHGSQVLGIGADDKAHVVWTQGTPVGDLASDITTLVEDQQA
jgi:protein SCO1/2